LLVTAGASGAANAVGGTLNRTIQGQKITLSNVGTDFAVGAVSGVFLKYN